ncbi:MAG: helix-hairpin-helix domain-containing protein [Synergistaceae bacterium]|jgi:competence protein ComEA|nr:helix-hairpin-helix domain-containing protein [Synergistaceae bacterium]
MNAPGLFGYKGPKYLPLALAVSGVLCLVLVFLLAVSLRGTANRPAGEESATDMPDEFVSEGSAAYEGGSIYGAEAEAPWVVYVTGAVMKPGVYEIPAGSRVNDAVRMAGGLSRTADEEAVNLAEEAEDGLHISVPDKIAASAVEAAVNLPQDAPPRRQAAEAVATGLARKGKAASGSKESKKPGTSEKVNINEATAEELRSLPGIGPVLSGAIITYRETNGPFTEAEDLTKVNGIGRKRFESVRDFITVSR